MSSQRSFIPIKIRSIHSIRKNPTPTPTVTISTILSICGTDCASTDRSGSDTVTATPRIKLTKRISQSFFDFVRVAPIRLPMTVIEVSAPRVKRPIPTIIITVPIRNARSRLDSIGVTSKHKIATIITIGSTDTSDSLNFSFSAFMLSCDLTFLISLPSLTN